MTAADTTDKISAAFDFKIRIHKVYALFRLRAKDMEVTMPSSRSYAEFIMDQLSGLGGIALRAMMGEYIIYYNGKIVGGIYDDRFLVKPTKSAVKLLPTAPMEIPYPGAKEMLLVEKIDDRSFLEFLLNAMYDGLPEPKKRE